MSQRVRKSKQGVVDPAPKAIANRTLDDDLPTIKGLSEEYTKLDQRTRELLQLWVPDGKTLEYYHGYYNCSYHIFTMATVAKNELAPTCMHILTVVSWRIITVLEAAREKMKAATAPLKTTLV